MRKKNITNEIITVTAIQSEDNANGDNVLVKTICIDEFTDACQGAWSNDESSDPCAWMALVRFRRLSAAILGFGTWAS